MHYRKPEVIDSREIGLRDAAVLVPLVACILALALYPGLILGRSDSAVKDKVNAVTPALATSSAYTASNAPDPAAVALPSHSRPRVAAR
jgi:NADH:ubiquinone oxidoreductase subunit 4 (subunit M)